MANKRPILFILVSLLILFLLYFAIAHFTKRTIETSPALPSPPPKIQPNINNDIRQKEEASKPPKIMDSTNQDSNNRPTQGTRNKVNLPAKKAPKTLRAKAPRPERRQSQKVKESHPPRLGAPKPRKSINSRKTSTVPQQKAPKPPSREETSQ